VWISIRIKTLKAELILEHPEKDILGEDVIRS
jgi:hypothetical protein